MDFTTLLAWSPISFAAQMGGEGSSLPSTIIMFGAMFAIMYFMVLRPQQKRMKEHKALLGSIRRGDDVVLSGGMHGKVHEVEDTTVLVEVPRNTVIKFEKGSVTGVTKSVDA